MKNPNIVSVHHKIKRSDRCAANKHKSALLWFTGLPGSGKSSVSQALCEYLHNKGIQSYVLDGDNVRHGLNQDLGFSAEDRRENVRRIAEVGKLFVDAGMVIMTAFISPYREDRARARSLFGEDDFLEIYVKCSLDECEKRDPKGLYKKARNGEIKGFTGVDDPYEEPENPELIVDTEKNSLDDCVEQIVKLLNKRKILES